MIKIKMQSVDLESEDGNILELSIVTSRQIVKTFAELTAFRISWRDRLSDRIDEAEPAVCIGPTWEDKLRQHPDINQDWKHAVNLEIAEYHRFHDMGISGYFAESVLPMCTATHIIVRADAPAWIGFLEWALDAAYFPQLQDLAKDIFNLLKNKFTKDQGYNADEEPFKTVLAESSDS